MRIMAIAALAFLVPTAALAADTGAFNCFNLSPEDLVWFQKLPMRGCCQLADGMPTPYEHRDDGYYIPAFEAPRMCEAHGNPELQALLDDKARWVKVPSDVVKYAPNGIGWAVVWWTQAALRSPGYTHTIRCFIPLAEG